MPVTVRATFPTLQLSIRPKRGIEDYVIIPFQILSLYLVTRLPTILAVRAVFLVLIGFVILLWIRLWFHTDLLTMDASSLTLSYSVFGLVLSKKSYENREIVSLRYAEWPGGRQGTQTGIRFESAVKPVIFARQASKADCTEVLEEMNKVYNFHGKSSSRR